MTIFAGKVDPAKLSFLQKWTVESKNPCRLLSGLERDCRMGEGVAGEDEGVTGDQLFRRRTMKQEAAFLYNLQQVGTLSLPHIS